MKCIETGIKKERTYSEQSQRTRPIPTNSERDHRYSFLPDITVVQTLPDVVHPMKLNFSSVELDIVVLRHAYTVL